MSPLTPSRHETQPHIVELDHEPIPFLPRISSSSQVADNDMGNSRERSHLEIIVDSQHLTLKGTGVDVEPTQLSGHVMLYLHEDTTFKELTLQFRGKAKIPIPSSETLITNSASSMTYVVCSHDWSFLEGDKKHNRTVKAGRHFFPFHLSIGGSLPSSILTTVLGGASVTYKLRALAVRSGLSHNLHSILPIYLSRTFGREALEYQQTLEIENTWPDKLMYSIVLPHKAWAIGDNLTAILKFSPIAKGARVSRIKTSIHETTKVYARSGAQEESQVVASAWHEIVNGRAVRVEDNRHTSSTPTSPSEAIAGPSTLATSFQDGAHSGPSSTRSSSPVSFSNNSASTNTLSTQPQEPESNEENSDTVTSITLPIPPSHVHPSHSIEPIIVNHRVRWNIFIHNPDGHTSELRCSLPVYILDQRYLQESRSYSSTTRRLVLGSSDIPPEEEEGSELPSYDAHVRDRVANMFLPEAATVRVNNPWVNHLPITVHDTDQDTVGSRLLSGHSTPAEPHTLSQLPTTIGPDGFAALNLLNCEILHSLSEVPRPEFLVSESRTPSESGFHQTQIRTPLRSRSESNSRSSSPDGRHQHAHDVHHNHHHYGHGRNFQNIFRATIKPFTALTHHNHDQHGRRNPHHDRDDHPHHPTPRSHTPHSYSEPTTTNCSSTNLAVSPTSDHHHLDGVQMLHRLFSEVPDYSIASRGFIGGVPPLESMRGLPSYDEVERSDHNH